MKSNKQYAKVTEFDGMPKAVELLPLAFQHVVAMIVGCVTPAIILCGVLNADTHTRNKQIFDKCMEKAGTALTSTSKPPIL